MPLPAGVPADTRWCYDAEQLPVLADNAVQTSVPDVGPNGWTATQGTATSRALYKPTGLAGRPALLFDGAATFYQLPLIAAGLLRNVPGWTFAVVAQDESTVDAARRFFIVPRGASGTTTTVTANRGLASTAVTTYRLSGGSRALDTDADLPTAGPSTPQGRPFCAVWRRDYAGGTYRISVNGVQTEATVTGTTAAATSDSDSGDAGSSGIALGGQLGMTNIWHGLLGQVAVGPRAWTDDEQATWLSLTMARYLIPDARITADALGAMLGTDTGG